MPDLQPITRRAGPLRFSGITAATARSLEARLGARGFDAMRDAVFADLTLGAWRGHAAAADLCLQLGIPWQTAQPLTPQPFTASARVIARMIDQEASGRASVIDALDLARRVRTEAGAAGGQRFVVLLPLPGIAWQEQDVAFLGFLRQGGDDVLLWRTSSDGGLPSGWSCEWDEAPDLEPTAGECDDLAIVPGVIAPEVAANFTPSAGALRLRRQALLVGPEHRRPPAAVARHRFDRLASMSDGWLGAYAQIHGTPYFVDPALLCREASLRFGEGA